MSGGESHRKRFTFTASQITETPGVLFRSNSIAMKIVSTYARLVGQQFLETTLGPLVNDIIADSRSVEVAFSSHI